MVSGLFTFVPKWTDQSSGKARCQHEYALLEAAPYRGQRQPALLFHECGRGGTGRRATLRSLWAKARGSSSLLDRTSMKFRSIRGIDRFHAHPFVKSGYPKKSCQTTYG